MSDALSKRVSEHRAGETARGRNAVQPHHIPWRGWKDILYRLWNEVSEDRVGTVAAGTTFFLLLAIFPALAALVSLYGLVADPVTMADHVADMKGYVPAAVIDLVGQELQRLNQNRGTALSIGFVSGILIALWSANNGVRALFDALNVAYDETEKRGFFKLLLTSLCFTLGGLAFAIVLLNVVIGVPLIVRFLQLGTIGELLVTILPALVLFAVALLGLAMLYRFGPSRARPKWRWVTAGSLGAAVVWLVFSVLFSWYLSKWTDYSATYGSLGAIIGVMMWIYLSLWVVLVGAELNAEIEHQTAQDTTVGPDKPLGSRGAFMADDVGQSQP
ncbi:YihY/virulence factor BrkB family protein [Microvirga brassicacearum]|uniref:YihY/virulence factor BrkB family protein n=1 Tax=Microvirga brassicacearum TaxID=2580413 RepID=A0A5N3PD63_9HYPH|nr:YihY/virulence factor BrkB family protein [Microvirga brassicacearum]KAB0267644.1 YihY/virulence factor BrkB family protein [Microvirga brassicacearum]